MEEDRQVLVNVVRTNLKRVDANALLSAFEKLDATGVAMIQQKGESTEETRWTVAGELVGLPIEIDEVDFNKL